MTRPFLALLTLLLTWGVAVEGIVVRLAEILSLDQYDGSFRPRLRQGATKINVSMVMHTLIVDETRQVLEMSGELLQEWYDPALVFPGTSANIVSSVGLSATSGSEIRDKVWRPDLTAEYDIKPQGAQSHGDFLRIQRDGHVTWSQRIHYTFPCLMDLSSYPLGAHTCFLRLNSLGYESSELDPNWYGDAAVDYSEVIMSHGYELCEVKTEKKTANFFHKVKWQLVVEMELESHSRWQVKHTVIPMIATVTTAYLSFFINIRATSARVMLCMMSLMTAAVIHESTYNKVPPASATMAIEVFTGTCLTFIFVATVETVMMDVLSHFHAKGRHSASPHTSFALEPDLTEERGGSQISMAALWLDRCFRVLYPAGFIAFNAVYWVMYKSS
ncbi:gamma-aminobutyric acid receptor subunit beta-4-like isoform X2 [Homarus americanus]|uniref:gamma-aminobutyric acid receptor subunit beta-4-like isoform X2 n=1 Tax=Homarus americanus TaxID=6706 RepID=UPI001C46D61E|nr:gamma-aminobutyric acid receptor subunit beta-4-like isoform X2 [Homarus americanus]